MTEPLTSTMNELNQQLKIRMFELLNFVAPEIWGSDSNLIYSPIDDLSYATLLFQEGKTSDNAQNLLMPFAYYTRGTADAAGDTYNWARRMSSEWFGRTKPLPPPLDDYMVKFIPGNFYYYLKIYDSRLQSTEAIYDRLLHKGIREKSRHYQYNSDVLGISAPYRIWLGNPRYDRTPTTQDRTAGKGRVYSLILPFEINCVLGEGVPAVRIKKINDTTYYYRTQGNKSWPPLPGSPQIIDSFVIDSNNTPPDYPSDPELLKVEYNIGSIKSGR
jgi:hypothetical protein